jgi:hypothetical protein
MKSHCDQYDQLEKQYIRVRTEISQKALSGGLTQEEHERLLRLELRAQLALLDHRSEHGCQRVGD